MGVGELMWFAWNSSHWSKRTKTSKHRAQTPWAGGHFYGLTTQGARFLLKQRVDRVLTESHMGTCLHNLIYHFQRWHDPDEFGCCYINPGLGHYMTHASTTNVPGRVLPSHWDESWVQGGTRQDEKAGLWYKRYACHISDSGPPTQIGLVEPTGDEDYWWRTGTVVEFPDILCGVQSWHKFNNFEDCIVFSANASTLRMSRDEPFGFPEGCRLDCR